MREEKVRQGRIEQMREGGRHWWRRVRGTVASILGYE